MRLEEGAALDMGGWVGPQLDVGSSRRVKDAAPVRSMPLSVRHGGLAKDAAARTLAAIFTGQT